VLEEAIWKISKVSGVSSGQAAEIATNFAELILGKDESKMISKKTRRFVPKGTCGADKRNLK
jgi:hypothetical protein